MPLACLRRLLRRRGLNDESSAKTDVVRKFIKDAFPDMSDEEIAKCESEDASSYEGPEYDPVMANQSLLAELGELEEEEEGHHEEAVLLQHLLEERDRLRASRELQRSQAPAQTDEREQRRELPFLATRGLTQKEAKGMCPTGWVLSMDTRRHHRWQITERCAGRSYSKTFAMSESKPDDSALPMLPAQGVAGACVRDGHRVPLDLCAMTVEE